MQVDAQTFCSLQLPTYLGNKRNLLPIFDVCLEAHRDKPVRFLDGFSGSGVVSRFLKTKSNVVDIYCNDWEYYASVINGCFLQNVDDTTCQSIRTFITEINARLMDPTCCNDYFIYGNYTPLDDNEKRPGERGFFTAENGKIIDRCRNLIDTFDKDDRNYFLAPLLVKASKHSNTCGYFNSFYKVDGIVKYGGRYAQDLGRICCPINLDTPIFFNNWTCNVNILQNDIMDVVPYTMVDIAYFDPPYNKHPYGTYYFMLNTIAKYEKTKPVPANMRGQDNDWRRSKFNSYRFVLAEFEKLLHLTHAKEIWVSYNSHGILPISVLQKTLENYGTVTSHTVRHEVYNKLLGQASKFRRATAIKPSVQETFFVLKRRK